MKLPHWLKRREILLTETLRDRPYGDVIVSVSYAYYLSRWRKRKVIVSWYSDVALSKKRP